MATETVVPMATETVTNATVAAHARTLFPGGELSADGDDGVFELVRRAEQAWKGKGGWKGQRPKATLGAVLMTFMQDHREDAVAAITDKAASKTSSVKKKQKKRQRDERDDAARSAVPFGGFGGAGAGGGAGGGLGGAGAGAGYGAGGPGYGAGGAGFDFMDPTQQLIKAQMNVDGAQARASHTNREFATVADRTLSSNPVRCVQ
jgi:hypothetical protein